VLDLCEVKPRAPRTRIGTAPRDALAQRPASAAGPASYTPDEARLSRHAAAPRARIGSAGRFPGASSIAAATPGPAAYYATIDALRANVEGGFIGGASRARPRSAGRALAGGGGGGGGGSSGVSATPGPNSYVVEKATVIFNANPRTVIGSAPRFVEFAAQHEPRPGAADYSTAPARAATLPRSPSYSMRAR
jgi:hypothetical protein